MSYTVVQTPYRAQNIAVPVDGLPKGKNTYLVYAEGLGRILLKYKDQIDQDAPSYSLFKKGRKLMHFVRASTTQPSNESFRVYLNKIADALRDRFGTEMLKKPQLFGEILLEKSAVEYHKKCLSVLSLEPIEAKRHDFAKEMIRWYKSLSASATPPKPAPRVGRTHQRNAKTPVNPTDRIMTLDKLKNRTASKEAEKEIEDFAYLYDRVIQERAALREGRFMKKEIAILREGIQQRDLNRGQDLVRLDHHWTQQTQELKRAFTAVNNNCRNAVRVTHDSHNETKAVLKETRRELVKANNEIGSLKGEVGSLRWEVSSLSTQVAWLGNEVNNRDSGSCSIS